MNEEPMSSPEKAGKGRRVAVVWLVLVAATFLVLLGAMVFLPGGPERLSEWIPASLFVFVSSFAAATVLVGVWRVVGWLCCWRHLKGLLVVGGGLAVLVALFYAEEDWRGWHAWHRFQQEWGAKGEPFTVASVAPAPVPDEQNFALTPIAYTSYGQVLTRAGKFIPADKRDGRFAARMRMGVTWDYPGPTESNGNWAKGTFTRLGGWQKHYREIAARTNEYPIPAQPGSAAADVLLALSRYDGVIEEVRVASRLAQSRFPVNYESEAPWEIALPHLAVLKGCAQVLRLRSVAELEDGKRDLALEDVRLALQLVDKIRTEPLLVSHLVRIAMVQLALQPVWEGLAKHRWSEAQLAALEAELSRVDFAAAWRLSLQGELGGVSDAMRVLRRHPERLRELRDLTDLNGNKIGSQLPKGAVARWVPAGWYYQNQVRFAELLEGHYLPVAEVGQGIISPDRARQAAAALAAETPGPCNVCARLILPMLGSAAKKFAYGQGVVNLARVAIGLERWRLGHGAYPELLGGLAPECVGRVPHDVIDGQALKYRREKTGGFVLYSVGWNKTDEGGEVSLSQDGAVDIESGDWVWRYPVKSD